MWCVNIYLSSPQCVWAPSLGWHQLVWWSLQLGEEPGRCGRKRRRWTWRKSPSYFIMILFNKSCRCEHLLKRFQHINLIGCRYTPHRGTPRWPATLSVMSSPLWLHGQMKNITVTIWSYLILIISCFFLFGGVFNALHNKVETTEQVNEGL